MVDGTSHLRRLEMAESSEARTGMLGELREKLSGRRERRAKKAHAEAETKREWERSGEVGRHGAHEGYSSGSG
jgi:hypothetical protein